MRVLSFLGCGLGFDFDDGSLLVGDRPVLTLLSRCFTPVTDYDFPCSLLGLSLSDETIGPADPPTDPEG